MYFSPFRSVRSLAHRPTLGELNIMPLIFGVLAATGMLLYSFCIRDYYVFSANFLGLLISIYFTLTVLPKAPEGLRLRVVLLWILGYAFLFIMACVDWMVLGGYKKVMGGAASFMLLVYYSSPLTTFSRVIRTRNAIYFDIPIAVAGTFTASLWATYGFIVGDIFIM
jgi:hypothetical protein